MIGLLSREHQIDSIEELLTQAREGTSGSLVLRGEPGIGLTTLLHHAVGAATGMRVLRIAGADSTIDVPFAGLHQLVAADRTRIERLPTLQRAALHTALGLSGRRAPDVFGVAAALLSLLVGLAEEGPLLCAVDDADTIDSASGTVLAFVAHRLAGEGIALLVAVHDPGQARDPFRDLPESHVEGLSADDARAFLDSVSAESLDPAFRERLVDGAGGNPLALIESRRLGSDRPSAPALLAAPLPLGERLEERFGRQARGLPEATQTLLLVAAALHTSDASLFWRAVELLGLAPGAAAPAEDAGLLHLDPQIEFSNALTRSAVYGAASGTQRRAAHGAIADAIDGRVDPTGKAWHSASATLGSDEDVAVELEAAAVEVAHRGDFSSAAALLERGAGLSAAAHTRVPRLLAAAEARLRTGAAASATALLGEARALPLDAREQAVAGRLDAEIAFTLGQSTDAAEMLVRAAEELEPVDARLAQDTHLMALEAAIYSGHFGVDGLALRAARAGRHSLPAADSPTAADLLLDGLVTLFVEGHAAAMPTLRGALEALQESADQRWVALGCIVALEMWDDEALHALTRQPRDVVSLNAIAPGQLQLAGMDHVVAGELVAAEASFDRARDLARATSPPAAEAYHASGALLLAAWRGHPEARELIGAGWTSAVARGLGRYMSFTQYALAVLENGVAHYDDAFAAATDACERQALYLRTFALPELVEAGMRSGQRARAQQALSELEETAVSGTAWARGMVARSRALLSRGRPADRLYIEAIEQLRSCRAAPHLARAHLLYGEWLRRERRRRDARRQLRIAYQMFSSMGIAGFAGRAHDELAATGEHRAQRTVELRDVLTAQEARIARLAADGASNAEIGTQLFISPKTVEYHMHKVFTKLQITTRIQLTQILGGG